MLKSLHPSIITFLTLAFVACGPSTQHPSTTNESGDLALKNYRPQSAYHTPKANLTKPSSSVIDMHSHPYAANEEEMDDWVATMDELGITKTVLLTYQTGNAFDSLVDIYGKYPDRFDLWCGFDYTGYTEEGWVERAIAELERCKAAGAKGIGELGDKGLGLLYSKPTPAKNLHINDPRIQPLIARAGELGMPLNIHVAEPYWMYLPTDSTNDGMMNAANWKIDLTQKDILGHQELINTLDEAVGNNPGTTFIACHLANCGYNLEIFGKLLDKHSNLYADISARYAETATIPRYMNAFYTKYQDRLFYGTDMGMNKSMYLTTVRILESEDEHFYETDLFNYHWALYGFGLDTVILKKIYRENAERLANSLIGGDQ